jgi:hypothetical protein
MARWKIISGARSFYELPGRDIAIGWARDLERDGVQRTVSVCVRKDAEQAAELPGECRNAIRTHGRTVFDALLDEDEVPRIVDVTTTGLEYEYGGFDEPDEDEDDDEDDEDDDDWDDEDEGGDEDLSPADQDASTA